MGELKDVRIISGKALKMEASFKAFSEKLERWERYYQRHPSPKSEWLTEATVALKETVESDNPLEIKLNQLESKMASLN